MRKLTWSRGNILSDGDTGEVLAIVECGPDGLYEFRSNLLLGGTRRFLTQGQACVAAEAELKEVEG